MRLWREDSDDGRDSGVHHDGSQSDLTDEKEWMDEHEEGEYTVFSPDDWRNFLRLLTAALREKDLQQRFQEHRGSPRRWGDWLGFSCASLDDLKRAAAQRAFSNSDRDWPAELVQAKIEPAQLLLKHLKGLDADRDYVMRTFRSNFLLHSGAANDLMAFLSLQDLLTVEGPLESIPLEQLEVAWTLRLYPSQVALLGGGEERPEYGNLQVLRKRVNQLIETGAVAAGEAAGMSLLAPPFCPSSASAALDSAGLLDLRDQPEAYLVHAGCRAIELLNLQEIVSSCQTRLWRNRKGARSATNKALILAGVCGAEMLHKELKSQTEAELPANVAKCRLNATLYSIGLRCFSPEASLVMRAKAREYSGKATLVQHGLCPLLFTAPHNIVLVRDGKPPHRMEESGGATCLTSLLTTCPTQAFFKRGE